MRGFRDRVMQTGRAAARAAPALACALLLGCADEPAPPRVPGGQARLGQALIAQYQCGACHTIPEVAGARGNVGPPLAAFARRSYIAGHIPNLPDNLVRWLIDPPAMVPGTAMPALGLSEDEARHMAAYLYSLE